MSHDSHDHESPKRVYFGIPIAFALSFWFIVFLSLKACDGPKEHGCCMEGGECNKECMENCKKEGKGCVKACEENMKEGEENRDVPKASEGAPESKEEVKGKEGEETKGAPAEEIKKEEGHH
jgi:hypothetical protein